MAATDASTAPQDGFVNPVDGPFLRFPPFPSAPEGVTIMSFQKFEQLKEGGIRLEPGPDDEEVDSYGIPTIPLRPKHQTDYCKTNTKRKRRAEEAKARKKAGMPPNRIWWEQWEETEAIRHSIGFNPHSSRFERIHAAATDFTNGRTWPITFASETGPKFIWEKFQRYLGIPEGSTVPQDTKKGSEQKKEDDSDDDDMDEDAEGENDDDIPDNRAAAIVKDKEVAALAAEARTQASNEEKLSLFFSNPEKSFKVFMSSYSRAKGYIWSDANLECMPRVLLFFVNFLLRSKVLPEIDRNLRRSVEVITLALTELPSTSSISKVFPDKFSLACTGCWDKKAEGYQQLDLTDALSKLPEPPKVEPEMQEPAVLLVETDPTAATGLKEISAPVASDAWNTTADSEAPWGTPDTNNIWAVDTNVEDDSAAINDWLQVSLESLCDLLGPTTLPLTHTTGVVERSMRQIKSIIPPNPNPPKSAPQGADVFEPDAEAVEIDLDRLLTKVVLSPMAVDWDGGETPVYSRPTILDTSNGPVVEDSAPPNAAAETGTKKPHDPLNDDITLLIESKEANVSLLQVGMSLGGTWVQLTRQGEVVKKKKKGKSKKTIPNYWYLDELAVVAPSFWAVNSDSDIVAS